MRAFGRALVFAALSALAAAPVAAGTAAQLFYVPLPEGQVHAALTAVFPGVVACGTGSSGLAVADPILTTISIAPVAEGTVITYDHWEDGYEADITRPTQPGTAIWGDGDPSNGIPPGFATDLIGVGDVIVLHNPVAIADRGAVIDFDGGDKLAASLPVSVTRAAWASGTGTLMAGAVDVRDAREWGRSYRAPIGEDVGTTMFEHTSLLVMARKNATRVAIDADADGSAEISVTLDEGRSHHVRGGVRAGAAVTASEPVQAALITGDVCAAFQSRWFALEPTHRWSGGAVAPVGTPAEHRTTVYVFNPGPGAITVVQESLAGPAAGVPVAAGGVHGFEVPGFSAVRLRSEDGRPFSAVGAVDTGGSEHEWGFSLVPEHLLTPQALVGWGPGRDPSSAVKPDENAGPAWVTPVLPAGGGPPVAVCADYGGDNLGPFVDDAGFRYDRRLALEPLESARVYDPDGDQTGMILYICDDSGARLAVAWGQDPSLASPAQPGIDLGTTVPPLASMAAAKEVELAVDADGDGLPGAGDTLRYTIRVRNVSRRPVTGLVVSDELPAHTSYVAGSALLDGGAGPAALPDAGITPFPLDEGGVRLGTLPAGGALAISFLAVIDDPLPPDLRTILNVAIVRSDTEQHEVDAELPLAPWRPRPSLALVKTATVETAGAPGTGTIGYWKNHPEAWPVAEVIVGGRAYARDAAIALMARPGRGDKTVDLFRQLVAARLNIIAGNEASCVAAALAAADAWLAAHPPGSGIRAGDAAWLDAGAGLHTLLDDYNNGLLCAPHRDDAGAGPVRRDVVFTITVTNDGNVELTDVGMLDPAVPACSAAVGRLAPGGGSASVTCRVVGVVADLTNVATASGTAPDGTRVAARAEVFVDLPDGVPAGGAPVGVRTLAFWRARPEAWPVLELSVGAGIASRDGILGTLESCAPGDASCALFGQLAAARLNLLAGAESSCVGRAAAAADTWLAARPPGSGVRAKDAAWRRTGRRLHGILARYNRGELCAPPAAP